LSWYSGRLVVGVAAIISYIIFFFSSKSKKMSERLLLAFLVAGCVLLLRSLFFLDSYPARCSSCLFSIDGGKLLY
jgi:hypothetical protein